MKLHYNPAKGTSYDITPDAVKIKYTKNLHGLRAYLHQNYFCRHPMELQHLQIIKMIKGERSLWLCKACGWVRYSSNHRPDVKPVYTTVQDSTPRDHKEDLPIESIVLSDSAAQTLGFEDLAEFHSLVSAVDISGAAKLGAFKKWQYDDGTKKGLLKLGN